MLIGGIAMENFIIGAGILCIIAALVGGGVTVAGGTIPVIKTIKRQILLGVFGAALLYVGLREREGEVTPPTTPPALEQDGVGQSQQYEISPRFEKLYSLSKSQIGEPLDDPVVASTEPGWGAYQAKFSRGMVIWIRKLPHFIIILNSPSSTKGISYHIQSVDNNWSDVKFVRNALSLNDSAEAPLGGVAQFLSTAYDTEGQKYRYLLGDFKWMCRLDGSKIFYQDFQNGIMIGPFRDSNRKAQEWYYAVSANGTVVERGTDLPAPECLDIPQWDGVQWQMDGESADSHS